MAVGIEDILLARAQQDEQSRMSAGTGALLGAGIAGTAGVTVGDLAQRLKSGVFGKGPALKPGMRMAGGLVGAVLGGALGAGAAQMMQRESPAARLLAKLQTQGDLSASDQQALQNVLADTYSNTLGM